MRQAKQIRVLAAAVLVLITGCTSIQEAQTVTQPSSIPAEQSTPGSRNYDDLEIVTLLPRDAIPAIDNPQFITVDQANTAYDPDELILGVTHNGETKAYPVGLLSSHEIVNDTIGGAEIAVTW